MGGKLATRVPCDMPVAQPVAGLRCCSGSTTDSHPQQLSSRTWYSKALLAFTGHVPLPADFCYAVNCFVAQLAVCAST